MRVFKRIPTWLLAIGAILAVFHAGHSPIQGDPSDDFSFLLAETSLLRASAGGSQSWFGLMPEDKVRRILEDQLDFVPKSHAPALARHLLGLCRQYGFDPALILSLVQVESGFRVRAVSPMGAIGLMQLLPSTAEYVARRHGLRYSGAHSLENPFTNLSLGVAYLWELRERYRAYSPFFHIAAYNIGPGRIDELIERKEFRPVRTRRYFEAVLKGVPAFRDYLGNV